MKILENEKLDKYTTFKVGGIAKKLFFPENIEDIVDLYKQDSTIFKYIISGGSNLIINDEKEFENVICMREFEKKINKVDECQYYISSSLRLQEVINKTNSDNCGGIEYLFSVPALIGGAIYMNAGRGKKFNQSISDYIEKVVYFEDGEIKEKEKNDCQFNYRTSFFKGKDNIIILGAYFKFNKIKESEAQELVKKRIELCKEKQDMSYPNFGSVFSNYNERIMKFVRVMSKLDGEKQVHFSSKTLNWLLKGEAGNFQQTMNKIERVKKLHNFLGKKVELEAIVWE